MMRQWLRAIVLILAGIGALLGATPGRAADDKPTVLRFAWWGGAARHEATLKAIAEFERRNPGLKIKAEYMGFNGYLERLTTQIAGGSEPDVMQINWAWMAMFSKKGNGFVNLESHRSLLDLAQFSNEDIEMGRIGGKLNALTVSYSARVMLWNEASFKRAGLSLPRSWDEIFAAGPVLRKKLGEQAFALDGELYDMILLTQAYIQQKYGTPYVDPTQPRVAMSPAAVLEWVGLYRRLVDQQVVTPLPLRASLGGAEKPTEQQPDWVNGNWAGNYTWDSVIPLRASTLDAKQKLVLGEFPTLPGASTSGMFGRPTLMYAVGRNSKQAEIAVRLINFLTTDLAAARILGRTRGLPAAAKPLKLLADSGQLPPLELAAYQQIRAQREAGRVPMPSMLFEHARFNKFMREVFETVAYGKATDQEAADRLIKEGNALLKRIR